MQRLLWHHCPHKDCDSKYKSESDLKCHKEGHYAIDSGKTFPCQQCNYIGKTIKRLADHKQTHKEHKCHYAGCNAVYNHWQKLFNHKKRRITFKVCCNKGSRYLVLLLYCLILNKVT